MLSRLTQAAARVRALFRSRALDRDFAQELESHVEMLTQDNLRRGMTPEDARRAAVIRVGGQTSMQEQHREARGLPALETFLQDLRYGVRTLRRDPGFTVFAVLIVGLGVGASSTIFSVVNTLLLQPLPFADADRLVWVANNLGEGLSAETVQSGYLVELRERNTSFSDLAAYSAHYGEGDRKLTGHGDPERLTSLPVSQNFFPLLGIQPQLGRSFTKEECAENGPRAVMLSDGLWRRRFSADPSIVGRAITLNENAVTVVGVLPASFDFAAVFAPGGRIDLYSPLAFTPRLHRRGNTLSIIGRLKPGVTVSQARGEVTGRIAQMRRDHADWNEITPKVIGLDERVSGRFRSALIVLVCAVGVVMLIVCANLSNLLLARTAARQKEMAVRAALGAGRGRLIRQMLTESLVLSGAGALLGLALAVAGTTLMSRMQGVSMPMLGSVSVDLRALGFTTLIAILTGFAFGLLPALQVPAVATQDRLKENGRGSTGGPRQAWTRAALVVAEIAFACVLLVGAGLLIRSFLRVMDLDLGYRPQQAAALRIDPGREYSTREKRNAYYDEALRRVREIPGVDGAGLTDALPLGRNRSWNSGAKGQVYSEAHPPPETFVRVISDGYLKAMGIPLIAGRDFTPADTTGTSRVILINETMARTLWPGKDPIGQTVIYVDPEREVIGVVGDVRHLALEQTSGPEMYLPIRQSDDYSSVDLVVRTTLPPGSLASAVRAALAQLDPSVPANAFRPLQNRVDKAISPRKFVALLLAGFAAFALVLASLGIYGVISYSVTQRTQELGIRLALGASSRELQGRILWQTLRLAAIGLVIGVFGSVLLARALSGLLFGVTPADPVTFLGMTALLAAVAAIAGYLPARRVSRINPTIALRGE